MKIGLLTNTYPPNSNGVSVAVSSLEKALVKAGHEVFVATPKIKGVRYAKNILPIRSTSIPKDISPDLKLPYLYIDQVTKFFKKNQVELVHTHDTVFGGPEGLAIAGNLDVPAVHTYHTLIESYNYWNFPGYKRFVRNLTKQICNSYKHIISPSKKIYDYLLKIGVKVPMSQVFNIPEVETLEKKEKPKKLQKFSKNDFVIVSFCRLAKEKSVDVGLRVLAPLMARNPDMKFLICGDGPEKPALILLAKELEVEDQVFFAGKYKRTELAYYCSLSKLFLFTSTTENLPTNIFEAMYFGLPAISVDDSSVDYILKNNKNGFKCISFEDMSIKIQQLFKNPIELEKFSKEAKLSAQSLDKEKITNQHIFLYETLIEEHKKLEEAKFTVILEESFKKYIDLGLNRFKEIYHQITANFNQ